MTVVMRLLLPLALLSCADESDMRACDRLGARAAPGVGPGGRCNGAAELCDRRYNQIAFPGAHNAMANAENGWFLPDQERGIARAFADGIRALKLTTYYYRGEPYLCHTLCQFGRRPLADGLCDITAFLDSHPGEVVSVQIQDYVSPTDTATTVSQAGLLGYVYTHPPETPWPTLREMLLANQRVVFFAENNGGGPSWYHDLFSLSFETRFGQASAAELDCQANRGTPGDDLFTLNHFLTEVSGSRSFAEQINHNPLFGDRARRCQAELRHIPNFVLVDFYDVGDLFAVVKELNGL